MKYIITNEEYYLQTIAEKVKEKIESLDGDLSSDEMVVVTVEIIEKI